MAKPKVGKYHQHIYTQEKKYSNIIKLIIMTLNKKLMKTVENTVKSILNWSEPLSRRRKTCSRIVNTDA